MSARETSSFFRVSKKVREIIITFPTRKKNPDIWQKISCNLTNFFVHCGKQSRWWLDSPTKYKSSAKLSSSILEDIKSLTEPTLAYFGYWDKYVSYIVHISNIGSREMRSILYWQPPFFYEGNNDFWKSDFTKFVAMSIVAVHLFLEVPRHDLVILI